MPSLDVQLIADFSALETLAADWERLWHAHSQATVFSTFAWTRAAWEVDPKDRKLCVAVVRQAERVVAILPLANESGLLRFLGGPHADYNDILCEPCLGAEVVDAAFHAIGRSPVPWRVCILDNLPEGSALLERWPHANETLRRRSVRWSTAVCPFVDLGSNGQGVLDGILQKKSLRRHERNLAQRGDLRFRHLDERMEAKAHLPTFFRQHIARHAMGGTRSLFLDPAAQRFYERLIDELDPGQALRFSVVELDGRPIAYHFGFETRGTLTWYKPAFDVDYWNASPGEVLLKNLFQYARERHLQKFDFTVGGEAFKSRFANRVATNYTLRIFPDDFASRVRRSLLVAERWLKTRRHATPALRSVAARISPVLAKMDEAITEGDLARRVRAALRKGWHRAVFERRVQSLFSVDARPREGLGLDGEVKPMTLSDLAQLAALPAMHISADQLTAARARLKQGDRLYGGYRDGKCIVLAWIGTGDRTAFPFDDRGDFPEQVDPSDAVLYDLWPTAPAAVEKRANQIVFLLQGLPESDQNVRWVYDRCRLDPKTAAQLSAAGIFVRCRLRYTRWLGYMVSKQIDHPNHV